MLRLLIDENFNQRILRGLRLRVPSLDYVVVQETAMQGLKDPPLLRDKLKAHTVQLVDYFPYPPPINKVGKLKGSQ